MKKLKYWVSQLGYLAGGLFWGLALMAWPSVAFAIASACALQGFSNVITSGGSPYSQIKVHPCTVIVFAFVMEHLFFILMRERITSPGLTK